MLPAYPLDDAVYGTLDETTLMGNATALVHPAILNDTGALTGIRTAVAEDAALAANPAAAQLDETLAVDPNNGA